MNPHDFWSKPTAGEIPAVTPLTQSPYSVVNPVTPMPAAPAAPTTGPLNPPLAHVNVRGDNTDFLLTSQQKAMIHAKDEILTILSHNCHCDKCQNGVLVILSDLVADVMNDTNYTNHTVTKLERAVKHLADKIDRYVEGRRK